MTTRMVENIDPVSPAQCYDDALRWIIPSRTNPHESYVVELNDEPGYSVCQCMWFVTTFQPILARGMSPEEAVARGLVKLKKGVEIEDALKCFHILDAEKRLARATVKAFVCARAKTSSRHASTQDSPPPRRSYPPDLSPPPRFRQAI